MKIPKSVPLLSDFENSAWEDVTERADARECRAYWHLFAAKAEESQEAGDEEARVVFSLMYAATSLHLNDPASTTNPFCPMLVDLDGRTPDVDDFTDEQLEIFGQLIPTIKDAELRARIADVVWVRKRGHQIAEQAVSAYLASARRLEDTEELWPPCVDRIERAVTLAVLHGKNSQMFSPVITHIEDMLARAKDDYASFLPAELMKILLEHKQGDCIKYAEHSGKFAEVAEKDKSWTRAKAYWELQALWLKRAEDMEGSRAASVKAALTHVKEAEACTKKAQPDYLVAARHIQSAIEAFRRIGSEKDRIEKLHYKLLEYQRKGAGQFGTVSAEAPIHDMHTLAVNAVEGKSFRDAMYALATLHKPSNLDYLRQEVERTRKEFPLQHLFPRIQVDSSGRVTGRASSGLSDDTESREDALRPDLLWRARTSQSIAVLGLVEPARHAILREHYVRVHDFAPLISDNPFVPEGTEGLYARGLHAGVEGDFVVATHLLIPQLENSIRHVLAQRGLITSGLDSEGIQDAHLLGNMLYRLEMKEIFGEDLTFDLQGLLWERFGANLRNQVAHGLANYQTFFAPDAIYLWWLTLHLLFRVLEASESQTKQE